MASLFLAFITIMDIMRFLSSTCLKHDVSEAGFSLCLQVESTKLGRIALVSRYEQLADFWTQLNTQAESGLRNVVFNYKTGRGTISGAVILTLISF
jgi:hypothetical protein